MAFIWNLPCQLSPAQSEVAGASFANCYAGCVAPQQNTPAPEAGAGCMARGRRRLARPRWRSGISAYWAIGDRAKEADRHARGAPQGVPAGGEAWGWRKSPASSETRNTVGGGASCATPSREVVLHHPRLNRVLAGTQADTRRKRPRRSRRM